MALFIENLSGVALEIGDLGVTIPIAGTLDLTEHDSTNVRISAADGDIDTLMTGGSIQVLDPFDDTTALSLADGREALRSHNNPHYNISDSRVRIPVEDATISFNDLGSLNQRLVSAGALDVIDVTDGGAGTVDVAAGQGIFHTSASDTSPMIVASWPAATGLALTDKTTHNVYVDYNGGSPVVAVTTDLSVGGVNGLTQITLAFVDRDGTTVTIIPFSTRNDSISKIVNRLVDAEGLTHPQGAGTAVQDLGSNNIGVTAGSFWFGLINIPHQAFDTSVSDTFAYWRRDGAGGWIEDATAETQWDNLFYDDDPGLVALNNNRYTSVWIYLQLSDNNTSELHCIYGTSNAKDIAEASLEDIPGIGSSLPPPLQRMGVLIGRFIVQRSATVATIVESAFTDEFGSGGGTQNLWETVAGDSGSTAASSPTTTLTVAGGAGVTTSISGDTLTVALSGGGGDELVKVSANDTTSGYLGAKLIGVTNETALSELNDAGDEDLEIGIADNPVLPGTGSVTVNAGTTAQRPGSPTAGMMRYNTTTGLMEYYNGTSWIDITGTGLGPGTYAGSLHAYHYLMDKFGYGEWLGTTTKHIPSDEVSYLMPFDCNLVAITFSCDTNDADLDIFVEVAADGAGSTNSTLFNWTVTNARVARISTESGSGGPGGLAMTKGTKMAIFADNPGGGTAPKNLVVSVYVQWSDVLLEEDSESYTGDFS